MTIRVEAMGWGTREPCKTCPYRRDVPAGTWHREEFDNLRSQDSREFGGSMFGCHTTRKTSPQVCAGWLFDQKRRGVPSFSLRLRLMTDGIALAAFDAVTDGGHDLYDSIDEMCRANARAGKRKTK